jgi:hypothetical protein
MFYVKTMYDPYAHCRAELIYATHAEMLCAMFYEMFFEVLCAMFCEMCWSAAWPVPFEPVETRVSRSRAGFSPELFFYTTFAAWRCRIVRIG